MIPADKLRARLRYEPDTGKLFWLVHTGGKKPGCEAFTFTTDRGYKRGGFAGKLYMAHRVIWAMVHGTWPENEIDHINGNKSDNRIDNLRPATRFGNTKNVGVRKDNRSGLKGASYCSRNGNWSSRIQYDKKTMWLGYFPTAEAAHAAYCEANERLHGEFGRTK